MTIEERLLLIRVERVLKEILGEMQRLIDKLEKERGG